MVTIVAVEEEGDTEVHQQYVSDEEAEANLSSSKRKSGEKKKKKEKKKKEDKKKKKKTKSSRPKGDNDKPEQIINDDVGDELNSNENGENEEDIKQQKEEEDGKEMKHLNQDNDDDDDDDKHGKGDDSETIPAEKEDEVVGQSKRRRKRKRKKKDGDKTDTPNPEKEQGGDHEKDDTQPNSDDNMAAAANSQTSTMIQELDRTVYLEGIPYDCTEQDVLHFLYQNGGFAETTICDIRLPTWQDTGRLRGYGHVVVATVADYQTALSMNKKYYLQNRYISIQPAQKPKTATLPNNNKINHNRSLQNPSRTLILTNLAYSANEEDIYSALEEYQGGGGGGGKSRPEEDNARKTNLMIVQGGIRVVRHSQSGRSKGFAYVEFANPKHATAVMENPQPLIICGRPCLLDYDHGRVKGSFRTADGKLWHKEYNHNAAANDDDDEDHRKKRKT